MKSTHTDLAAHRPEYFKWHVEGKVGVITIDRPDKKNPLTFESYAELRDFFHRLQYAGDIKAIVVTGAGGDFCSGGDVHEIIGPLTQDFHRAYNAFVAKKKPEFEGN